MSVCAGYRSSGRQSPVKRTIPLFRPLCTTEKPPQLSWFSSALQSLNDTTPQQHHHKQRMAPPPPPPPPLPPRGGTDQQQQQRKSLTSRWLESKQDSDEESVASAAEYNVAEQQQQQHHMSTTNTVSTNFGVGSHSTKPYGDNEIIDEHTRRSLETMSVVKEEPEEETEDIGSVRLLSRRTLEDDNGIVHRSDFLKSNYPFESSESDEDDHPNAHLAAYGIHRLGIYEAPNASDGNPVRHSLLNLVAEEDIPELLQAMAEECHFVFDDCDRSNMPTTSGIIHTPAKRMERRKQRNVDRICFDDKHPEVFAYVDESAAYEDGEWSEGFPITYEEYKQIVEAANAEAAQQHMDLSNWRMLMEQKFSIQDEQIRALTEQHERDQQHNIENQSTSSSSSSAGSNLATQSKQQRDEELGVTSTFSYSSTSSTSATPLTSCSQPLQMNLRQTDRETSAM
jgi:hypothetical protein